MSAKYIEKGFAKVAPCECSTGAIHEKAEDGLTPVWKCRNCGNLSPRRRRPHHVAKGMRINLNGDIEIKRDGVWRVWNAE